MSASLDPTEPLGHDAPATAIREALGGRRAPFAIGVVTPAGSRMAAAGAPRDADFEIGSVSKGITGLLYADALSRREVRPDSVLADHLPLQVGPAARVRLADLASHRSGLARLAPGTPGLRRTVQLWTRGSNPYPEDLDWLIGQTGLARPRGSRPRYSNFGYALLGHAVAAAAGLSYPTLVRRRITEPLELGVLYVPNGARDLREAALPGRNRSGQAVAPWVGEAIAPAGGVRATLPAMTRLIASLLDGTAPGMAALDPIAPLGRNAEIGAAWITVSYRGRAVTWHNGGTGGFRSWLGLDRSAGVGVVVLSATTGGVDRVGFALLEAATSDR